MSRPWRVTAPIMFRACLVLASKPRPSLSTPTAISKIYCAPPTPSSNPSAGKLYTQHAEEARISKKLVLLDDTAPLPLPLAELKRRPDHQQDLIAFLQHNEFRSLLARMGAPTSAPMNATGAHAYKLAEQMLEDIPGTGDVPHAEKLMQAKQDYELVQDEERLQWWVKAAQAKGHMAIDTETDSLTASTANWLGFRSRSGPAKLVISLLAIGILMRPPPMAAFLSMMVKRQSK